MSAIVTEFTPGKPRKITVEGVQGQVCTKLTQPFERILGKVISSTPTPEAAMAEITPQTSQEIRHQ